MNNRIPYLLISVVSLSAGLVVAFLINQKTFFRGFAGDVLIVIFIYSVLKMFRPKLPPKTAALGVFLFASTVELLQYAGVTAHFGRNNILTILTLGSTFDPADLAAYLVGTIAVLFTDYRFIYSDN